MGAWGTRPFDSDGALDWYGSISDFVSEKVENTLDNSEYPDEWYAAAGIIPRLADIPDVRLQDLIPKAIARLDQILADRQYIQSWKTPGDYQHHVNRSRRILLEIHRRQPRTSLLD